MVTLLATSCLSCWRIPFPLIRHISLLPTCFLLDAAWWLFSTTGAQDTLWPGKGMTSTDQHQVNAGLPSTDEPLNANREEGSL